MSKVAEKTRHAVAILSGQRVQCMCGWQQFASIDDLSQDPRDMLLDAYNEHKRGYSHE